MVASECDVRLFRGGGPIVRFCSGLMVDVSIHVAVVGCGASQGRMAEGQSVGIQSVPGGCKGRGNDIAGGDIASTEGALIVPSPH